MSTKKATLSRLKALQGDQRRLRNICILAHVDHGKTSLADTLVASNGIISMRAAGEVRYMDYTEEEQRRGITMKASSIALLYNCPRRIMAQKLVERKQLLQMELKKTKAHKASEAAAVVAAGRGGAKAAQGSGGGDRAARQHQQQLQAQYQEQRAKQMRQHQQRKLAALATAAAEPPMEPYEFDPPAEFTFLINMIDSPGHVDFSCDVATAIRNCDGALIVVDVVEGVCVQTQAVIKQGFLENLRPVLVLNKLDRLVTELELTPPEAYDHLVKLLEQVNTVMGSLYSSRVMRSAADDTSHIGGGGGGGSGGVGGAGGDAGRAALEIDEVDEERHYFSPTSGNVVFASARDGWAFTLDQLAKSLFEEGAMPGLPRPAYVILIILCVIRVIAFCSSE
jgi:translation elongation factor EF-G